MSRLAELALKYQTLQLGKQEKPRGSNWGHPVQDYLLRVGIDFPASWCAALVYWSYDEAALELGIKNPLPRTAGSLRMWNDAKPENKIPVADVLSGKVKLQGGDIGIQDHGHGNGHTVMVERQFDAEWEESIDGNTNDTGSREGFEVEHKHRRIDSFIGFLRY